MKTDKFLALFALLSFSFFSLSLFFYFELHSLLADQFLHLHHFYFYFLIVFLLSILCFFIFFLLFQKKTVYEINMKKPELILKDSDFYSQIKDKNLIKDHLKNLRFVLNALKGEFFELTQLEQGKNSLQKVKNYFLDSKKHVDELEKFYFKSKSEQSEINFSEFFKHFYLKNKIKWKSFNLNVQLEENASFSLKASFDLFFESLDLLFDHFLIHQKSKNPQLKILLEKDEIIFEFLSFKNLEDSFIKDLNIILDELSLMMKLDKKDHLKVIWRKK